MNFENWWSVTISSEELSFCNMTEVYFLKYLVWTKSLGYGYEGKCTQES